MSLGKIKKKIKKIRKDIALVKYANQLTNTINEIPNNNFDDLISELKKNKLFRINQKTTEIMFVLDLIKKQKPKIICEIGAYRGGSLCAFSKVASPTAKLISVDLNYPFTRKMAHKRFKNGRQKIICVEGNTQIDKTVEKVKHAIGKNKIDFLFIDGDHSIFGVMNDFVRFSPLVKKGGIIAFHDIWPDQFMRTGMKTSRNVGDVPIFWEAIKRTSSKTVDVIENPNQDGYGIGVLFLE
jgi:predicted O-methyltransferase YrrM